jgi:hypothetical protein
MIELAFLTTCTLTSSLQSHHSFLSGLVDNISLPSTAAQHLLPQLSQFYQALHIRTIELSLLAVGTNSASFHRLLLSYHQLLQAQLPRH